MSTAADEQAGGGVADFQEAAPLDLGALIRIGICGPNDGVVEIFSVANPESFLLPVRYIDRLIAILSSLDRTEQARFDPDDENFLRDELQVELEEPDEAAIAKWEAMFMYAITGPYDGVVEIFLPRPQEPLSVAVGDIDRLIALLSRLDRDGKPFGRCRRDASS